MANVTVFVFLLQGLPNFHKVLNISLSNISNAPSSQCEPERASIIWNYVNKPKTLQLEALTNGLNKNYKFIDDMGTEFDMRNENIKNKLKFNHLHNNENFNDININKKRSPRRAPFLVAIFETFLNTTAETCAASLMTSQWVLTSASCIDLLSQPHRINSKSYYTIIANADNPLVDGTVHNVTKVVFNSNYSNSTNLFSLQRIYPSLALMRIDPAVKVKPIKVFRKKFIQNVAVKIVSWTIHKNSSGQNVMTVVSFPAKIVDVNKCINIYKYVEERHIICIMAESEKYMNQINSGGPVLISNKKTYQILAVAELSGIYFIAYSLWPYQEWIYNTISTL